MTKLIGIAVMTWPFWRQAPTYRGERIRYHVKFLASDLLEGRGVGARGGDLATEYIATAICAGRAEAGGRQRHLFPARAPDQSALRMPVRTLSAAGSGQEVAFRWLDEFVGYAEQQKTRGELRRRSDLRRPRHRSAGISVERLQGCRCERQGGRAVHQRAGIERSEILRRQGAHLLRPLDLQVRGSAAARRAGMHHHSHHADRGLWLGSGARTPGARESRSCSCAPGEAALAFAGWITQEAGDKLLGLAGKSVDEMLKAAESRDFRPDAAGRAHPRQPAIEGARDREPQRGRSGRGQRSEVEVGSGDLQRALGPFGRRYAGGWRRHLQRRGGQRDRLRRAAGDRAGVGGSAAEAEDGRRCFSQ